MTDEQREAVIGMDESTAGQGPDGEEPLWDFQNLEQRERVQALAQKELFARQAYGLRQSYGDWILRILGAQLLVADVVFVAAAWVGRGWDLTPGMTEAWLLAAVVQVVGVVAIVTRHLFPDRGGEEVSV